jgi:hypothetical protein
MDWRQFLLGLAMAAARKFPLYPAAEALQIVLDNHVVPLTKKLGSQLPAPSGELAAASASYQGRQPPPAQMPAGGGGAGQDVEMLASRFCELHELLGEEEKLLGIFEHYSQGRAGLSRQGFLQLVGDAQLMDRHLPQKQCAVIFMTAVNSKVLQNPTLDPPPIPASHLNPLWKAEDALLGMQQLLDALCMIAARKFADASSRVAGTQFLMESYILPYAKAS